MSLQQLAQNLKQQANTSASHYITLDDHILQRSDGGISQLIKDSLLREQGNIILVIKPDDIPDTPPDTGFELKGITPNTDTDVFLKLKNQSVTLNFVVVNSKIEFKLTIKLTESWQFSNSFDAVSVLVFDSLLSQGEESGLLSEKEFIFSSFQESQTTENLEAGLNFSAQIQLMGVLGYITDLLPQTTPSLPTGETGNSPNQYTLKGAIRQNQNTHQPEFDLKADLNVATLNLPNQQPILEISDLCVGANLTYVQSSDQEEKWESFPQLYLGGEITLENSSGTKMPLEIRGFLPDRPRLSLINFAIFPSEKDRLSTSLDRIGSLVGGHSWDNFFQGDSPELQTLHNCLKTFGLKSFATSISIEKFSVLSISVNVGTLEPWSFFEGQFQIKYFDLSWMIIDPLDKSIMFVTLATELELFNDNQFIFDITVQVPDLRISGAYKGQISFSFKSLVDKITSFFEIESLPLPDDLATFSFSNLYTEINVPSKVFSLSGNADISLHLFGIELLGLHQVYFFVSYDKQNKTKPLQASLTGIITILGLDFYVDAEIREKVTFQIHMVNQTFGSLLGYLVKLVDPDIDFTLDAPWDILNSIKMDSLVLNINITDGIVNLKYTTDLDLEFIVITAFDLSYFKAKGSVDIAIECKFLGQSYGANNPLKWDALNESPPSVSGKTTTLDLRFLAVGQHIAFKDTTEFTKVYDVLNKLGDSYKPQDISKGTQKQLSGSTNSNQPVIPNGDKSPIKSPLDPLDALQFDPNAGWLIGADLTLVDAVTVGVIFNDPELYGLYISLSGPKVKILDGLSFQILYKKINDHLGEYFLELKLPDIMRHWEFGEVSLTLPIIDISIYTNGNFKLDFGFPYNNDFSRSFSVQAFPFEGAGGFYFAMLNGDTSNHVPVISNGRFDPVIEFGLGLQIGVGKDINEGVLSAGIDITLAGVLQGVIAVFNPDSNALVPENYYLIQGAIAIVGKLYGKIDLAIIKIDISVTLYASVQLVVECYQPIYITLSAGVEVRAFIQIVFIKIDFHFSA
ncbi:MAG: hypothetical protein VKL42_04295, partial [Snowella sp.]|nr:hypothetical protein [Snowella sp.]